jgi:hypothetical protein
MPVRLITLNEIGLSRFDGVCKEGRFASVPVTLMICARSLSVAKKPSKETLRYSFVWEYACMTPAET